MFTHEEAIELIREEKILLSPLNLSSLKRNWKAELKSNINEHNKFFLDIYVGSQGFKIVLSANSKTLKTSHNHRIDKIPLIRLDYGGRHKNPERANNRVPNWIAQFAGESFNRDKPHVHIYVESNGLPDLKWAVPLDHFELDGKRFSLPFITSFEDFLLATKDFAYIINILNYSDYFEVNRSLFE